MKHNILYLLFIALFLLASCQQEEPAPMSDYGYLALSVQAGDIDVVMTRAEEEEEPLIVELWKGDTKKKLTAEEMQEKIRLEVGGDYKIVAYTNSYNDYESWTNTDKGEAVYYGEFPFVVEDGKTTRVNAEVPMINLGVKLVLPEGFETLFPTYTFNVTVGERAVALRNGETAYFPYDEDITAFNYELKATNVDGEEQTDEGSYKEGIAPGTLYIVTYAMETQSLAVVH